MVLQVASRCCCKHNILCFRTYAWGCFAIYGGWSSGAGWGKGWGKVLKNGAIPHIINDVDRRGGSPRTCHLSNRGEGAHGNDWSLARQDGAKRGLSPPSPLAGGGWVEGLFAGREGHEGFNPRDINDQKLMRAINKRTTSMDVDSAGRIGLSESLRKQANLDREVTVVGNYDHLEVWDRAAADEDDDDEALLDLFFS